MKSDEEKACCCSAGDFPTIKHLFLGIPLLASWWLIYSNLVPFSKYFTYELLNLPKGAHLSSAVEFFVYDTPKVLLLLTLVVFGVGVIRSFFTPDRTRPTLWTFRLEDCSHLSQQRYCP